VSESKPSKRGESFSHPFAELRTKQHRTSANDSTDFLVELLGLRNRQFFDK